MKTLKILLVAVNAKYIHSNLAIYSLYAYAKKYKNNIEITEFTINQSEEMILKEIYEKDADMVAFSCYIWNIELVMRLIKELRRISPTVRIWLGGPEVSYDSRECLETHKELDGIMIGEGEQTFYDIAEYYIDKSRAIDQIPGIAYRISAMLEQDNQNIQCEINITEARLPMEMDDIPFPYEDFKSFEHKIIYYESSRGCPYRCSYCLSSIDKGIRLRSTKLVKKELKVFLDHSIPQVKFVDRTFNCNSEHAMEIWRFIKENDNGITNFHFEISADILKEDEIKLLATLRPGQIQLEIGVQSTNQETLKAIHRVMDFERLADNVMKIKSGNNIHQHLDLIAGLPWEDYRSFQKSFDEVYQLRPDQLQLGFLKVLKGSLMEEESEDYAIVYRNHAPYEVLFTKWLTYGEIIKLKGICEMIEVYYNSGQFDYTIRYLEHYFQSPMELYLSIYVYYENEGLSYLSHSRIKRFEILLNYFKSCLLESGKTDKMDKLHAFEELLLYDMYLREKLKSRPIFAGKSVDHKIARALSEKYKLDTGASHVEEFHFNMTATSLTGQPVQKNSYILFDYTKRDLINYNVKTIVVDCNS